MEIITLDNDDKLINKQEVLEKVAFKKSKLYELLQKDKFPKPYSSGTYKNMPRWSNKAVTAWINSQLMEEL